MSSENGGAGRRCTGDGTRRMIRRPGGAMACRLAGSAT